MSRPSSIRTGPIDPRHPPKLVDLAATRAAFSWDEARQRLAGADDAPAGTLAVAQLMSAAGAEAAIEHTTADDVALLLARSRARAALRFVASVHHVNLSFKNGEAHVQTDTGTDRR